MAPKKPKGDKKGKDKDGKGNENHDSNGHDGNSASKIENLTLLNEQLKKQLNELKNEYDFLRDNSQKFRNEFETKIEEQQEIILFLEKTIADMRRKQANLEETIRNDHSKYKKYQTDKENEIKTLKNDYTNQISEWEKKVNNLETEMLSITDFKLQKENIEKEVEKIQESLLQEKRERANREAFLERRFLSERERLKKEMLNKIRETKLRLLAMTQDQLHTTTKRTILENEQMTIELQYQSKETEKLLNSTKEQTNLCLKLKRQIELHKKTEKMLATRTYFLQKLVDQLNKELKKKDEKLQSINVQNQKLINENSLKENEIDSNINDNNNNNSSKIKKTNRIQHLPVSDWHELDIKESPQYKIEIEKAEKNGFKKSVKELKNMKHENKSLNKQLLDARNTYQRFLSLQDETVTFIWSCIEEIRNDLITSKNMALENKKLGIKPLNQLTKPERLIILERLFDKLNTSPNENEFLMYQTPSEKLLTM